MVVVANPISCYLTLMLLPKEKINLHSLTPYKDYGFKEMLFCIVFGLFLVISPYLCFPAKDGKPKIYIHKHKLSC